MSLKSNVLSPSSFFKATNTSRKKKFIDSNKFWWFSGKKANAIFRQEFLKLFKKSRKFRDAIFGDEPTFNEYKHLLKGEELEPLILEGFYSGTLSPDMLKDIESLPTSSVQHPEIKPPEFYAKPVPPIKYRKFSIPKRGRGVRKIQQPHAELMALQRKILPYLEDNYPSTETVYGFIPRKNIVGAAEKHLEAKILFNIDLKDAFTSVNLDHLRRGLEIFFGEKNSDYLLRACSYDGKLPTGAPTSPMLLNFALLPVDAAMEWWCDDENVTYTRYADDLTISVDDKNNEPELKMALWLLKKLLKFYRFEINPQKLRKMTPGGRMEVTGLNLNSGHVTVPRRWKRALRAEIHHYRNKKMPDFETRKEKIMGKIAYLQMVEGKEAADKFKKLLGKK